jgi:hypothetical protein
MRPTRLLMELETLASKLGVRVSYEPLLAVRSGLCRLHDEYLLIIDRQLSKREQVEVFIDALKGFDLEGVHVLPRLRDIIEGRREEETAETTTPDE